MDEQEFRLKFLTLVPRLDAEGIPSCNFSDAHIRGLRSELEDSEGFESWSQCPRTFALLFMVRDGRNMSALTASNFNDDILPYIDDGAHLRTTFGLTDNEIKRILKYHEWFLSSLESMEKIELFAENGLRHRPLRQGDHIFGFGEELGPSSTGHVCRGKHLASGTEFAIKRFRRTYRDAYKLFKTERSNLEKLRHPHLISLIGTYTDRIHFALILSPLATYDLKKVLAMDTTEGNTIGREQILRQSFGCLVSGLEYLHSNRIRHKDMKPGNILVHDGKVIICDLGIAYDWSESTGPTTSGTVDKQTWKYSAPEVSRGDPRNQQADIWSLGCVFLEIITVLQGHTIKDLHQHLKLWEYEPYHEKHDQILIWTRILSQRNTQNEPLFWIKDTLNLEPLKRPSAQTLHRLIKDSCISKNANECYIGDCCSKPSLYPELLPEEPVQPEASSFGPGIDAESLVSQLESSEHHNENTKTSGAATLTADRPGSAESGNTSPVGESDNASAPPLAVTNPSPPSPTGDVSDTSYDGGTRFFGYTSELPESVKNTQRTTAFRAEISAFEIFPQREDGHWIVQTPLSRSTFRVHVTESTDQPVWRKYRLLEILTVDGTLKESTWLPLHRLETKLDRSTIELQWSNCNHLVRKEAENFRSLWHRVFNPTKPNTRLRLLFVSAEDAEVFNQTLLNHRLCSHEGDPNNNKSFMVGLNANQKTASVHICKFPSTSTEIDARMICVRRRSNGFKTSEIYSTSIDYDIAVKMERSSRLVVVDLEHIKVPIYHSDVRDLPYENYDMEGRFGKVVEETKKLSMCFKLDDGDVAGPGRNLSDFFQSIIGWHLLFVAPIKARRSPTKFFHRSSAEETTLMLFNTTSNFRASGMGAKIVLLFQNGRPGQHKWITGELVQQKPWKKAGKDGEITIHRVQRAMRFGALSSNSQTTFKGGSSSYKLEFEDFDDLDYFNAQILPFERAQSSVSGQFHGPRRASRSTVSTRRSDTTREDSM